MVQQLFNQIELLKGEIRRIKGDLHAISSGGMIIPSSISGGGGVQMPLPIEGAILYGTSVPEWARLSIGASGEVLTVVGGLPNWEPPTGLSYTPITPVTIKTLTALGDEATWTDIDVSANVSSGCRLIQVKVSLAFANASDYSLYFRENGTAESNDNNHLYGIISTDNQNEIVVANVPIDSGHIFEYFWDRTAGAGNAGTSIITLLGYWD